MNNEKVDIQRITQRLLLILWITLFCCFIIKIFGGNWFEIICTNERFIKLCNFIDNNIIVKISVAFLTSYTLYQFYYLAIAQKWYFNKWTNLFLIGIVLIFIIVRCFIKNIAIGIVFDILQYVIIPIILFKRIRLVGLNAVLIILYMALSALVKNIGIKNINDNTLLSIIYSLDIYVILSINYIYHNTIRKNGIKTGGYMGFILGMFFSDKEKQLLAYKGICVAKHNKKLAKIDKAIAKARNKK